MSFHNQAFGMEKSPGCLNDDMTCDNSSRIESKRAHQWFMGGPEVDLLPNKKQAVEAPNNLLSGMVNSSISSWGNSSSFHSLTGHFIEQLSDPDAATMKFEDANLSSVSIGNTSNVERKDSMDPFGSDFSFGLSMSSTLDPRLVFNYDGIRKVEVNEVKESDNIMSVPINNPYDKEVSNTVSNPHAYKGSGNSISMNLSYHKGDANMVTMDDAYGRTDNLLSMVQSFNKGDDSLSLHQTYKEICNTISMDQGFSKIDSSVTSVAQVYNKDDDNSMSRDHLFNTVDDGTISAGHPYCKGGDNMSFVSPSYNRGESTIISFGGCDDDDTTPSGLFIPSYELLMGQAPSPPSALNEKELIRSDSNLLPCTTLASASETESVSKLKDEIKMSKKATSNNFPSNVKSLLSTGMLDGVSVKYKAWSQEELQGVIKGAGYLCSCQSCNFSKVINAYEFERHAGCKTKHPNNHIYFESGKTIYGVVQELRSTPQNMLFEVIQTVTGSPINQKSFRIWKESFMAAARELQRICGKEEVKQLL